MGSQEMEDVWRQQLGQGGADCHSILEDLGPCKVMSEALLSSSLPHSGPTETAAHCSASPGAALPQTTHYSLGL